ncbi:MAG: hypothetical protein ISS55_07900 [Dehalococcoidales bacterium]|nr:hypothetical protein [Dehalococcoidales bacterium]
MDKEKAIRSFLEHVDRLPRLPLVTDVEMDALFGEEVAAALAQMDRHNQAEQMCLQCESRCCQVCQCELYTPQFSRCPIQELRPVLCRFHFCNRFRVAGSTLMDELGDIFFDSLLAADREGNPRVRLFESPPLSIVAPGLVAAISPWIQALLEGTADSEQVEKKVCREAEKYRTVVEVGVPGD